MASIFASLSSDGKHIVIRWARFDSDLVSNIRSIPGARFKPNGKEPDADEAYWILPLEIEVAKRIRDKFETVKWDKPLRKWIKEITERSSRLSALSLGRSAELPRVLEVAPLLHRHLHVGPKIRGMDEHQISLALEEPGSYQTADAAFLAHADSSLNANPPGVGKTLEIIGGIIEAGMDNGANLVAAPITSLDTVWKPHLELYQSHPVIVAPPGRQNRIRCMQTALMLHEDGIPFWMVVNHAMLTMGSQFKLCAAHEEQKEKRAYILRACMLCEEEPYFTFPELEFIDWNAFIVDECHISGLPNPASQTAKGMRRINAQKRIATSGTPIGGKPIRLFGILQFLYPDVFTSKWRFAEMWMTIEAVRTRTGMHREIGKLRPEREAEFNEMLSQYMIRRDKLECLPWLPPKQRIDIWVEKTPEQNRQYKQFALEAEIRIDDYNLTAVGILAEYARLKQFSNAVQTIEMRPAADPSDPPHIILTPTEDSPKLPVIMDLLAERGIMSDDIGGEQQVVIYSESERMVSMVHTYLKKKKIPVEKLTGPVPRNKRTQMINDFQAGKLRVLVVTTTAGGVAIDLDKADTAIFLDESWNPDDQTQAEDRLHRASRVHQVVCIYLRTTATIQEYIQKRVQDKSDINRKILDYHKERTFLS